MFVGLPNTIEEWESKGLSDKKIKPPVTANHNLSPKLSCINNPRIRLEFKGSCLKQIKIIFNPNNVVNLFIVYELNRWSQDLNAGSTLKIFCLELLS